MDVSELNHEARHDELQELKRRLAAVEKERDSIRLCGNEESRRLIAERDAALAEIERLKAVIRDDSWNGEMQRALELIPTEFVQNDMWYNGIERMASALTASREQCEKLRKLLDDIGLYCAGNALTEAEAQKVSNLCLAALSTPVAPATDSPGTITGEKIRQMHQRSRKEGDEPCATKTADLHASLTESESVASNAEPQKSDPPAESATLRVDGLVHAVAGMAVKQRLLETRKLARQLERELADARRERDEARRPGFDTKMQELREAHGAAVVAQGEAVVRMEKAEQEARALRARVEELGKDKKRLDAIGTGQWDIIVDHHCGGFSVYSNGVLIGEVGNDLRIRAAIDAAVSAKP